MILLNPIWLYALAALSIPVAIHLWNVRPGKTLKVGSIALMNESAQKSSRSLKLHDIPLLFVRCLLLALVALVLTMPLWQKKVNSSSIKGWVLLPRENLKEGYAKFKPAIDSLTKAGYEFHYFDKGFAKAKLNEALADSIDLQYSSIASYWSLAQQLDRQVPSALPVYLFTPNGSSHFSGEKPQLALKLHWQTFVPADSTQTWVEKAYFSSNNDIQVVRGSSKPSGTRFADYTIQASNLKNTPFVINTDSSRVSVGTKNGIAVVADTSTWRFTIYEEKNSIDGGYLKGALASVVKFTRHKAVISLYSDVNNKPGHQNWIFWLLPDPVNSRLMENCDNLFAYRQGKLRDVSSWITAGDQSLSKQKIAVYKLVLPTKQNEYTIWADGFGEPVLGSQRQGQTNLYQFYSRFDPAWSDLVWSNDFPKMMLKLIVNQTDPDLKHDRRIMDNKQLLPSSGNGTHTGDKLTERTDLTRYFWLLLALVFVVERWLAHQKSDKKILRNG